MAKKTAPLFVIDMKGAEVDARSIPALKASEIHAAGQMGDTLQRVLALNVIAGKVDPALLDKKERDKVFTRSQRTDKGRFIKLLELDPAALAKAWNAAQETRKVKRAISLSGLVAAAKEAGLIPKGEAPQTGASETANPSELAAKIVSILSVPGMTPAKRLAAIAALPEIIAACGDGEE